MADISKIKLPNNDEYNLKDDNSRNFSITTYYKHDEEALMFLMGDSHMNGVSDNEPYLFRKSGGSATDIGNRESDTLVGGTVVWNQLVQNGNFGNDTNVWATLNGTFTVANNVATFTRSDLTNSGSLRASKKVQPYIANHVYFLTEDVSLPALTSESVSLQYRGINLKSVTPSDFEANTWTRLNVLYKDDTGSDSTYIQMQDNRKTDEGAGLNYVNVRNVMIFDLTQMFGTTIADYIYSLEQANAGAGVAWIRKLFPRLYYAYNPGELLSIQAGSHVTVGFNAWDEEWEVGSISFATGNNISDDAKYRSKNYVPLAKGAAYYFRMGGAYTIGIRYYDADKNYIDNEAVTASRLLNIPNNASYLRFVNATTNVYAHDICINLSWDGERDGEYEPYVKREYPLDSTLILRGIPKLDADDSLYYDGDTYGSDGTVTRRFAEIDLGTLSWQYSNGRYEANLTGLKKESERTAFICSKYAFTGLEGTEDKTGFIGALGTTKDIYIYDSEYDTASAFQTAVSGVMIVYELASPVIESADPYTNPQIVDKYGTERYVTNSIVPVGHETNY